MLIHFFLYLVKLYYGLSDMFKIRVIYLFALRGVHVLSFALSGEWCSVLPLVVQR
jgi:hypothetical protein